MTAANPYESPRSPGFDTPSLDRSSLAGMAALQRCLGGIILGSPFAAVSAACAATIFLTADPHGPPSEFQLTLLGLGSLGVFAGPICFFASSAFGLAVPPGVGVRVWSGGLLAALLGLGTAIACAPFADWMCVALGALCVVSGYTCLLSMVWVIAARLELWTIAGAAVAGFVVLFLIGAGFGAFLWREGSHPRLFLSAEQAEAAMHVSRNLFCAALIALAIVNFAIAVAAFLLRERLLLIDNAVDAADSV